MMKRLLRVMLCVALIFSLIPLSVYAAESTSVDTIDLNSKKDLEGRGYHWDAKERVLTLTNANLSSSGSNALIQLPKSGDVTIRLVGENFLRVENPFGVAIGNAEDATRGALTIEGDGTGTLSIAGSVKTYSEKDTIISDCIVSIEPVGEATRDSWAYSNPMHGALIIKDSASLLTVGRIQVGGDLTIENSMLMSKEVGCLCVYGDVTVTDDGALRVDNRTELDENAAVAIEGSLTGDGTSRVCALNSAGKYGLYMGTRGDVSLLSQELSLKGMEQAIYTEKKDSDPAIVLPEDIAGNYQVVVEEPRGEWHYANLYETYQYEDEDGNGKEGTRIVKELHYLSAEAVEEKEATRERVENTKIELSSSTSKGKVQLSWKKDEDLQMDYYEIFRSTKKNSGYSAEPYDTTRFGLKMKYTNSGLKSGKTYYYKIRGAKIIDGQVYYTQWSNKAWRTVK